MDREFLVSIALRAIPAVILYAIGWFITKQVTGEPVQDLAVALFGLAFMVAAALVFASPLARVFFGEPMATLFYPAEHFDGPQPMYSIPESKRKSGLFEEALAGYGKIAGLYPGEVRPYLAMMEIAIVDLKDPERGARIYEKGMSLLTKPEDQQALAAFYIAHCSRLAGPPEWLKQAQEKLIAPKRPEGGPPSGQTEEARPVRGKAR